MQGRELALQFKRQGMCYDEVADVLWCSLCTNSEKLVVLSGSTVEKVLEHCKTRRHLHLMQDVTMKKHHCPVEINGRKILLDHICIYPATMFGRGKMLLDDTLGCVIAVDVCGGVKLVPRHKYTVVEFVLSPSKAPIPECPCYHTERFARSKKCTGDVPTWITSHNNSIDGETALMKRRRISFGELNM
uniref:Uncharacterized protein TCIL3000_5_710 n=1 Tax=Trypanosoma congolense (strain IL3000) TaxID=1068625 RepID=G0UMH1_TRYCI|nr:unnamed protein product [Trypanosoma congolense IL3000]